jgi:hypothetical protein
MCAVWMSSVVTVGGVFICRLHKIQSRPGNKWNPPHIPVYPRNMHSIAFRHSIASYVRANERTAPLPLSTPPSLHAA